MQLNYKTKLFGRHVIYLSQINSTNHFAKTNINSLTDGDVIFTNNQTKGYGTKNHIWHNFKNKQLAISIVLKNITKTFLQHSTQFTAISLIKSLEKLQIQHATIKWFNDILISNKKIAGILGESQIKGSQINLIIGIGINLLQNELEFKKFNLNFAGSIFSQTQKIIPPKLMLSTLIHTFDELYFSSFNNTAKITQIYQKHCKIFNKTITVFNLKHTHSFECTAIKLMQNGNLLVKSKQKLLQINPEQFSIQLN